MLINDVVSSELCTGCGLCSSIYSDKVQMDYRGAFNRPNQTKPLNERETIEFKKICPGIYQSVIDFNAPYHHDVWGQYFYSGKGNSLDHEVRYKASSGGVLSQIAIFLIENNIVSGIIHIGPDPSSPLENIVQVSTTREEVITNSGSRYAPASPLSSAIEIISSHPGKKFAFIGKPCDVTALRQAQELNTYLKDQVPIVLSFFCAGTPSRNGVADILRKFKTKANDVVKFTFRGNGWPGETVAETNNDKFAMKYEESWGKCLGPTIQKRCKICADAIGENADIVSADVWEADERGYPVFAERDGQGLILSRNSLGQKIIDEMTANQVIHSESFDLNSLNNIQLTQFERKCTILPRIIARMLFMKKNPAYLNQRIFRNMKYISSYKIIRIFVGSLLRVKKGNL